jgi:hypothetical protein
MNAAETIAAAIEELEAGRTAATSGPWSGGLVGVYGPRGYVASDGDMWPDDRALIVTLHRTIDAQLKALRAAEWLLGQKSNPLAYRHAATAAIIELAEAILGESS